MNIQYVIGTIRDVFNYNYFEDITQDVVERIEKELSLIENIEDAPYTKTNYDKFHEDMLKFGMNLLPTIDREKRKIIMKKDKENFNKWLKEGLENGYIQEMDKQLRIQYGIKEECTEEQWKEAIEYFVKF